MADIGGTVRALLLANANVSGDVSNRIHSDFLPQGSTLPAIVYTVVSTVPVEHLSGIGNLSTARVQVDAYAVSRSSANSLGDSIRLALEMQNDTTTSGQYVTGINLASGERYQFTRQKAGSDERPQFITSQDFFVAYTQTTS